jgi:urease accessory protein
MQRTTGALRIAFTHDGTDTRLDVFFQQGAARARLPRVPPGASPEVVLINTAGGLTGGDRMRSDLRLGSGSSATITTQASEKIYRASDGQTVIVNRIHVESGAHLEWLPQKTILFDGGRLDRTLDVEVAPGGSALLGEAVVFGRTAMGETVRSGLLRDRWRVRRGGTLVFADGIACDGDIAAALGHAPGLDGGCALATILMVGVDAEHRLPRVRRTIEDHTTAAQSSPLRTEPGTARPCARAGASAWDDHLLAVRIAAVDGAALRAVLIPTLAALRDGRALPTVWHC